MSAAKRPVDWVDPWIDTANGRWFFFSSACRPFGMVNLSPDTVIDGAWNSGYRYQVESVRGFSHLHAWQLAAVPVLPTTGPMRGHLGSDVYRSAFSHQNETVRPGYHALTLDDYQVRAELTSTTRVGFHRYTLLQPGEAHILFDVGSDLGPTAMSDALVRCVSDVELEGYVENDSTRRRPKPTRVFFVARLNRPFDSFGGWEDGAPQEGIESVSGKGCGAYTRYTNLVKEEPLLLKVALSYVSADQARRNLDAELPHWDFDRVVEESTDEWNDWLSRIEVAGGTDAQRTKFYTDLWHALQGRRIVSDVDGAYSDMTGPEQVIRHIPLDESGQPRYAHYNSDAFWGAQWNLTPLWTLVYPHVVEGFCNCLVDYYRNGGLIPRGPSGGNYTFVMTSATSTPFIVSAHQKGIRGFDVETAYQGLRKNHFPGGLMSKAGYEHFSAEGGGVEYYIERGYVPLGIAAHRPIHAFHLSGAAQTLEYAYKDWCLAQMARALGKREDEALFTERAHNYRHVWDVETGFMRPRTMDGAWLDPFDPHTREGWVEGNAFIYTWYVPHDIPGLAQLMGGTDSLCERLDAQFARSESHNFLAPHGSYVEELHFGNQPGMGIAHVFNHAGAPWLSQKWVRRVKARAFGGVTPYDGYLDDEDQGQLGAYGALVAIGLFDLTGGAGLDPAYELTSPVFDRVTIHLDPQYLEVWAGVK